jgi:hypothetical protein
MQIANADFTRNPLSPSRSVDMSTEGTRPSKYRYELSAEEREKFDAALAAVTRIKATFEDWTIIGHAIVAARKYADRGGGRKTFQDILSEQRIMPPLDKATVSRLEKIMAHLAEVQQWRATLTEPQRVAWSSPMSVVARCTVFMLEKERRRATTPRKPTRLESALEENAALKAEVESYRRVGDCGFSRQDRATDIAGVLMSGLPEPKQRAVMKELVRKLGTRQQRKAFGLEAALDPIEESAHGQA